MSIHPFPESYPLVQLFGILMWHCRAQSNRTPLTLLIPCTVVLKLIMYVRMYYFCNKKRPL